MLNPPQSTPSILQRKKIRHAMLAAIAWIVPLAGSPYLPPVAAEKPGEVRINFVEEKTGEPISCRLELTAPNGKPLRIRGQLQHAAWTLVEGDSAFSFRGKPGEYRFNVFHGPQFSSGGGGFTLENNGEGADVVSLPRHANVQTEGWFGGDLLSFAPVPHSERWLPAEDLDMAAHIHRSTDAVQPKEQAEVSADIVPNATKKIERAQEASSFRWVDQGSFLDDRPGSGIVFHSWQPPAAVPDWVPSSKLLTMAKESRQSHADIQKLWARDAPIWLASGRIDSIQILSDHLTIDGKGATPVSEMYHPEPERFAGARGPGRLVEQLYWQVLETGLRIAPSAGSGFGRSTSPLGYNRVYVHCSGTVTAAAWWEGLRLGRSFVSSGPLLRPSVNGQLPGYVFEIPNGESLELSIGLTLTVSDPVEYLDVIFNGETLYQARLDEYAKQGGKIPPQKISESGWMVIRVVTEREHTYRIASTAPYYFVVGQQSRVSRSAVNFFQQWLENSARKIAQGDPKSLVAAEPFIKSAREFWRKRLEQSNAP